MAPRKITKEARWRRCPETGPKYGYFLNPTTHELRYRTHFAYGKRILRACTSVTVTRRTGKRVTLHPGMQLHEIWREVLIEERIRADDRPRELETAAAVAAFSPDLRNMIVGGGNPWQLLPGKFIEDDAWKDRTLSLLSERGLSGFLADHVVAALVPQMVGILDNSFEKALLYVPVDLRDPIEPQLRYHAESLRLIRDWLHRLVTGRSPARPRARHVWRDAHVYILARVLKRNVAQIGALVFSGKPRLERERLVRQILNRVGRAYVNRWGDHLAPPSR